MGILAALIIALLVSLIFSAIYRNGPLSSLLIFFLILFMGGMAAQFWIVPFGPVVWGVAWLPLLFIVLIFAFLFSTPVPFQRNATKADEKNTIAAPVVLALNIFIWALLVLLLVAVVAGYYRTNI